jgi:uncharacterized integral membrane protein
VHTTSILFLLLLLIIILLIIIDFDTVLRQLFSCQRDVPALC